MFPDIGRNKIPAKSGYRPEIDGLRAFAVTAVIINHFNKEILPNGYLGVDIFFVISGFVITSSLFQRPSKSFKDFISGFYERRVKRLVPALSIFVLITSFTICLFNPEPNLSLRTGLSSLFGLSNLYLLKQSTNYFAPSAELKVFTHTWSLGVEEQFYILFPFLIWFSGFGRKAKNGTRNLFLIVGTLAIISLIGFVYLYPINQSAAYFLMPTRFWEMASGCLLFLVFQKRKSIEQFLGKISPVLAIILIFGIMYLPMSWAVASTTAVVALTLILIASLKKQTTAYTIFTHPKVVYIGLISYSLYLWHWGVLSISRWTIGIHWWTVPFQVALMLALAITSYRYIETPVRKRNWFEKRWKTLAFGGGGIIILSGVLITLEKPLGGQLYTGRRIEYLEPTTLRGKKCLENISKNAVCYLIEKNSKQTLWLLGDSHAKSLALAGKQVANSFGMNLRLYSVRGTPFPAISRYRKNSKKIDLQLLNDQRNIQRELYRNIKVDDVILLSIYFPLYFANSYNTQPAFFREDGSFLSLENYFSEWIASVEKLANLAKNKGAKVIIQNPIPEWKKEYLNQKCSKSTIQWFNALNKTNCQIKSKFFIDQKIGLYKHLFEKLNQLSIFNENIYLFDTYSIVCPGSKCSFTRDGIDIYRDGDHLSYGWARDFIAPEISEFINEIQNMDK